MRVRPVEPADRDLIAAGFERLSPESRYRRFFAAIPRLTERQLDYLTQVDQHDHVALMAIDEASGEAIGIARFVRTAPGVAEPAVVVADDWQGRGVGGTLLDRLAERAREEGVTHFVAPVLADNRPAIRALTQLGDTTLVRDGNEVELTIRLPEAAPSRQSGVRQVLRTVAAGTIDPALVFWHRVAPRRGVPRERLQNVVIAGGGGAAGAAAGEIAEALGASLVLVAAAHPLLGEAERLGTELEQEAARLRGRGVVLRAVVRRGDLGATLLDEALAEQARLIVVGDTGGDQGVAGRLLGSAWDHVSHHAQCDVLVARGR
jgi:GNAT superfamily N-acetyltransferase